MNDENPENEKGYGWKPLLSKIDELINAVTKDRESQNKQKDEEIKIQRSISWSQKAILFAGLLSFTAAAIYAYVANKQLDAMLEANGKTADAITQSIRAYGVYRGQLEAMKIQATETQKQTGISREALAASIRAAIVLRTTEETTLAPNVPFTVNAIIENVGKSTAFRCHLVFGSTEKPLFPLPDNWHSLYNDKRGIGQKAPPTPYIFPGRPSRFVIGNGDTMVIPIPVAPMNEDFVASVEKGQNFLYIFGKGTFTDRVRTDGKFSFCQFWKQKVGSGFNVGQWVFCPNLNGD